MRKKRGAYSNLKEGAAMSFEEIGAELGITRGGAFMAYKTALRKLRTPRYRRQFELLLQLVSSKGSRP